MKKFHTLLFMTALLLPFPLSLCASGQTEQANADPKETVLHLSGGDWGLPSPYRCNRRGPGIYKMHLVFDSLLNRDEKGYTPWLAESWDISADGKTYTFHLENGVLWHDGEVMTASDVAFSFNYYREHSPVADPLRPAGKYIVDKARAIDESTVEITTDKKDVTYLYKLGTARIIPEHIWKEVADPTSFEGDAAVIGCGPFVMESYNPQQGSYRFVAFDRYWGLKQATDAIEFIPVSDPVLAFENREIDLTRVPADLLSRYESSDEFKVESRPSYHAYRLMMNMETHPELQDVNMRKAFAYGIDRQEIADKIYRGSAVVPSMGYIWYDSPWFNPNLEKYDYNPEKSKDLLGGKNYSYNMLTGNTPADVKTAELIKLSLAKVGIEINLTSVENKVRDAAIRSGNYDLCLIFLGGMGDDPDILRSSFYVNPDNNASSRGLQSIIGYRNDELNRLAQAQAVETDPEKRRELIFDLQEEIANDVPMVLITGAMWNFVYRPETYDNWTYRYGHNYFSHINNSYLIRE